MIETYYLDKGTLPTIPVPHDCIVKEIKVEGDWLVFVFEDDISYHDSIIVQKLGAKSLIIRYHLVDGIEGISLLVQGKPCRLLKRPGAYRDVDVLKAPGRLTALAANNLEYLYHYVAYRSIIIKLWSRGNATLELSTDRIEYEWIID